MTNVIPAKAGHQMELVRLPNPFGLVVRSPSPRLGFGLPGAIRTWPLSKPSLSVSLGSMGFWTYMLHCADGSFYVGHTDDLDARIPAHQSGLIKGYTSTRLPVTLVWCDEFPTRYEALQAERQIKGWGRAKKLALIRGDWQMISALARNSKEKERASTSSARTDEGTGFLG